MANIKTKQHREPLIHITKRDDMTFGKVFDPLTGYNELNIETK